jgi:RNA polymerase sigma factor (sigma-70 family)
MNISSWIRPPVAPLPDSTGNEFARLIVENLPYIERQCRRAVSRDDCGEGGPYAFPAGDASGNETDELLNEVLDHLKADDFRVLRQFQGRSKITTYLTTIISNLVVDLVRKKQGRNRIKERAREMGEVAERLYEAVFRHGYTLSEAHCFLETTWGITSGHAELGLMLDRMRGRLATVGPDPAPDSWPHRGFESVGETGVEIIVPDPARPADELLAEHQRERHCRQILDSVLAELSGEDRMLLILRFPSDENDEPKGNREIAQLLDLSEKAVDNRVRRILNRCRETLLKKGLSLSDLIDAGK